MKTPPWFLANERHYQRLERILRAWQKDDRTYVYRASADGKQVMTPKIAKYYPGLCESAGGLFEMIQHQLGAGVYRIMIRRGTRLLISGMISIGPPPRDPDPTRRSSPPTGGSSPGIPRGPVPSPPAGRPGGGSGGGYSGPASGASCAP